jgi:hypothetical protein
MLAKLFSHARHNVVAYLALFVALGGTAMAAKPMLTGADIQDGTINTADLRDRDSTAYPGPSIQGIDVEANSLTGAEINEASLGKVADADTLDGKNSTDFLGASAKAADSDKLDGYNSTDFKADQCPTGYVWDGAICWEDIDSSGLTLAGAANRCRIAGGRLPLLSEFQALAKSGISLGAGGVVLDWTANSAGNDNSIYIDNATDAENMDGVRANSTSSYGRCVHAPVNALGSP